MTFAERYQIVMIADWAAPNVIVTGIIKSIR